MASLKNICLILRLHFRILAFALKDVSEGVGESQIDRASAIKLIKSNMQLSLRKVTGYRSEGFSRDRRLVAAAVAVNREKNTIQLITVEQSPSIFRVISSATFVRAGFSHCSHR